LTGRAAFTADEEKIKRLPASIVDYALTFNDRKCIIEFDLHRKGAFRRHCFLIPDGACQRKISPASPEGIFPVENMEKNLTAQGVDFLCAKDL
jgi:hypothetical protein